MHTPRRLRRYACAHGYTLLYYRLARDGCEHPLWGARHPSYCKLAALAAAPTLGQSGHATSQRIAATPIPPVASPMFPTHWKASEEFAHSKASEPAHNSTRLFLWRTQALAEGYGHVVWLDSDAFVRDVTLDLPSLLRRYGGEPSTSRGIKAADVTDAYFGWDAPYSLGPNAGFAVLRGEGGEGGEGGRGIGTGGSWGGRGMGTSGTAGALEMLAVWWQLYHGQYGLEHAFEQHALHWQLLHLQPFRRRITTLRLRAMQPTAKGVYPDAVVHLDHNAGTETRFESPTNQSPIQTPNPMPECPTTRVQCTNP